MAWFRLHVNAQVTMTVGRAARDGGMGPRALAAWPLAGTCRAHVPALCLQIEPGEGRRCDVESRAAKALA